MTSRGREALAEAARLETARVYGTTHREAQERSEPAVTADELDQVIDGRRAVHHPNVVPIRTARESA